MIPTMTTASDAIFEKARIYHALIINCPFVTFNLAHNRNNHVLYSPSQSEREDTPCDKDQDAGSIMGLYPYDAGIITFGSSEKHIDDKARDIPSHVQLVASEQRQMMVVSEHQFSLVFTLNHSGECWMLVDKSKNGTMVNGIHVMGARARQGATRHEMDLEGRAIGLRSIQTNGI